MYSSIFIQEGNSVDLARAIDRTLNNISKCKSELISTQVVIDNRRYYCLVVYDTHKKDV